MVTTRSGKTYGDSAAVQLKPMRRRVMSKKKTIVKKGVTAALVKRVLLSQEETKRFVAQALTAGACKGNTWYGENLTYWIQNGSTNSQRIGDKIHITKFIVAGMVNKLTTNASNGYRFWCGIVSTDKEVTSGTTGPANGVISLDPRLANSLTGFTNPIIDTHSFTLHGYTTGQVQGTLATGLPVITGAVMPHNFRLEVPVNKDFYYKVATGVTGGQQYGKDRNYYVLWAVADAFGGATPNLADVQIDFLVEFKDA